MSAPARVEGAAFEAKQTDEFEFVSRDVGALSHVDFRKDSAGAGVDWFLESVEVVSTGYPIALQQTSYFYPFAWLEGGDEKSFAAGPRMKDYTVEIHTGASSKAGTSANVFLTIQGASGTTGEHRLNPLISGNAFERLDIDTASFRDRDVGSLQRVTLRHDGAGAASDWNVATVVVSQGVPPSSPEYFRGHLWLRGSSPEKTLTRVAPLIDVTLTIRTKKKIGAATNANVHVRLIGTEGKTRQFWLNPRIRGNAFRKGRTDTRTLHNVFDIGQPTQLAIGHDNSGLNPSWYLESVVIQGPFGEKTFVYDDWLEKDRLQTVLQ